MIVFVASGLLLAGLALRAGADLIAAELPPRAATMLLTALALTSALCTGLVLTAAAVLLVAQLGPVPKLGHWSAAAVRAASGLPSAVGVLAAVVVGGCLTAAVLRLAGSIRALVRAGRMARLLAPGAGDVVVVDDDIPIAYTVASLHGPIVISTAMLEALPPIERRVVIAHERSHLRHAHHIYLHLVRLAAAANPLLRPLPPVVARSIERWADEDAATHVGDRELTARALARAARARTGHPAGGPALAAADDFVVDRARSLLRPAPRPARLLTAVLIGLVVAGWVAAITVTVWTHNVIEVGEALYPRH